MIDPSPAVNLKRYLLVLLLVFGLLAETGLWATPVSAQIEDALVYESFGQATARRENYVRAQKLAIEYAFQNGLKQALRDMIGEKIFQSNRKKLKGMLKRSGKYVQSYRFLESSDSSVEKISRVHLEVTFFKDAILHKLNALEILKSVIKKHSVIVLVNERSLSSESPPDFWDYVPIAEVALMQAFLSSGIKVVGREFAREQVDEQLVLDAAHGDVNAAVDIGLKVGADLVIVGNAVSSRLGEPKDGEPVNIQANLSLRAVSTLQSVVIAARSDFATAQGEDDFKGELKAFDMVGKKMSSILVESIRRYWKPKPKLPPKISAAPDGGGVSTKEPDPPEDEEPEDEPHSAPSRGNTPPMMEEL